MLTGAESLHIIDAQEAFLFEILASDFNGTSAIWVAQRIPDDHATLTTNIFIIREIDYNDTNNFMGTSIDDMQKFA